MNKIPIWVLFVSFSLLLHRTNSVEVDVKSALISFLGNLTNNNGSNLGWNVSTDPCKDQWKGVSCDSWSVSVKKIFLDGFQFSGVLNASPLCNLHSLAASLNVLSLNGNNIIGELPAEIANCKHLTELHVNGNQLSGNLPVSLSRLNNLKELEISNNKFYGNLPDLAQILGLSTFLAQNNQLSGEIPKFNYSNFEQFNVSFNNLRGDISEAYGYLTESSFMGNPELCGEPLQRSCPPTSSQESGSGGFLNDQILMYSGYFVLGLALIVFIIFWLLRRNKTKDKKVDAVNKVLAVDDSINKPSAASSEYKTGNSRSEIMTTSAESALVSSSLVVLTSPVVNGLKFEDLLRAPAELLGRGKNGSVYKVIFENGMTLAVKRIKAWAISSEDFKWRMQRLDQVKHLKVLPPVAFYCSKQEKLLVYEYQQNGSLLRLLHGNQMGQMFEWGSRLGVAASIARALAFMHQELCDDGIAHGNLKSSNILLNKNMEPCISEYGLVVGDNQVPSSLANVNGPNAVEHSSADASSTFKVDVYGFGVILLELLTGKLVQSNGFDLTRWVHSVVHEEWTVEVFDKNLISEGASEERMMDLLQVAIKCVNRLPDARPSMNQVATMINAIKEEEERSVAFEI